MTEEIKELPEGLLAELELQKNKEAPPVEERKPIDTPSNAILPVDPNYVEPKSLAQFEEMAGWLASAVDTTFSLTDWKSPNDASLWSKVSREQTTLIAFLLLRVKVLESSILPFASAAPLMSNARMCLLANKREKDPAGGTWMSTLAGIQLQPNEGLFFNACDAYGRQRTHDHLMDVFNKLQEAAKIQVEKNQHVDGGGKVH